MINRKKGFGIAEVIISSVLIGFLSIIIMQTSYIKKLGTDSKINSEINLMINSYLNKAKDKCLENKDFDETDKINIYNKTINIDYNCSLKSENIYTVQVTFDFDNKTRTRNAYIFIQ